MTFEERQRLPASRASPSRERSPLGPIGDRRWGSDAGPDRAGAGSGGAAGKPSDRASPPARPAEQGGGGGGASVDAPSSTPAGSRAAGQAATAADPSAVGSGGGGGNSGWGAQGGWATPADQPSDAWGVSASGGGAANGWQTPASDVWGTGGRQNGWRDTAAAAGGSPVANGSAHGSALPGADAQAASPGVDPQQKVWYYLDPQVRRACIHTRSAWHL